MPDYPAHWNPPFPHPPVPMLQNVDEVMSLWRLVAAGDHTRVLEIGSLYGGTLWCWAHLPFIETLIAVDLPTNSPHVRDAAREARGHWPEWFNPLVSTFLDIAADSQSPTALLQAGLHGPFDFVFIDGDHTYDGVRADWLKWSPFVRSGGIVAFHDTWPDSALGHEPGVVRWVDELRHQRPSIQWTDPDGVGICAFTMP